MFDYFRKSLDVHLCYMVYHSTLLVWHTNTSMVNPSEETTFIVSALYFICLSIS